MAKTRIMLVEDEAITAMDIRTSLEELGYEVPAVASRGADAVRLAGETRPDLILMDITLDGAMNGIEASRQIQSALHIPIIFLTAHMDSDTLAQAKTTKPFGYLSKPSSLDSLKNTIEVALYKSAADARIRESEARYRTLVEFSPIATAVSIEGKFCYLNPAALRLLGAAREEELVGRPVLDIIHPDFHALVQRRIANVLASGIPSPLQEERLIRLDGTEILVEISGLPITYQGKPAVQAIFRDITAQKQAEEALRKSEELFRTVADFTSDWEYWVDAGGNLVYSSPSCVNLTGYSREELQANPQLISAIIHPDTPPHVFEHFRPPFTAEQMAQHQEMAFRIITKSGETRWLGHICQPVFGKNGEHRGRRASNRDITDRKLAEETITLLNSHLEELVADRTAELVQTNRDLHNFCYAISHELRAPVARLKGFSQLLQEISPTDNPAEARHCAERIAAASDLLQQVIDAVLQLSRLARTSISPEPLNLSDLAREVATELVRSAPGRKVELAIADGLLTSGDPRLLRLCLENLLGNALKYTAREQLARIEFGRDAALSAFYVRDNGIGFDMAHAGKLFEPFMRLHDADEFAGTGIGLAMVQRVIELHGGRIWAEAAPGQGATFFFTLGLSAGTSGKTTARP